MKDEADPIELSIQGEHNVSLPRQRLWESLNDPEVLRRCIRGCDQVERINDNEFCAIFKFRLGPLKKEFRAKLNVVNTNPPGEYQLMSSMDAGIGGRLTGNADVWLEELGIQDTRLKYSAHVIVEGWIGELGVKLLGNTAERYMQRFFKRMVTVIEEQKR